ncbi:GntR family transcriptional regulator [Streptomyces sp. NPDC021224]|uniref:GntR family transcriptional regulator n=1 Tax=unclassified Streptomyces TaxID=2593676 RepID=UPI0037A3024B
MIDLHVDTVYAQLMTQVREALRRGVLRPGDQLPTVLKAYRELELSGLVEARQGAGTFVSGELGAADPHAMARLRASFARWVGQAREAGLEAEDVRALIGSVLAEEARTAGKEGGVA